MRAKSIHGRSSEEINEALEKAITEEFNPTLAIIFTSVLQDWPTISETLTSRGAQVFGATSFGEFVNGYEDKGTIVILLLDPDPSCFSILFEDIGDRSPGEAAAALAQNALNRFAKPAFILCSTAFLSDGKFLDGELLIRGIEKIIGPQVSICGGMAGDNASFNGSTVFISGRSTSSGLAALVFNEEKVSLRGMAISGWKPLGLFRTVTKSKDGLIYSIDGQPAPDIYLKYLGIDPEDDMNKYEMFERVGVHYPFQVEREFGEPVMRTPMMINKEEHALMCDLDVPEGSKIRFSMPPDFDIVEKVIEKADELKKETKEEADALLIFSCAGRLSALGPLTQMENEGLSELWNVPMAGFYTYGEYGRAVEGKQEFHSTTCSWVVLKEK